MLVSKKNNNLTTHSGNFLPHTIMIEAQRDTERYWNPKIEGGKKKLANNSSSHHQLKWSITQTSTKGANYDDYQTQQKGGKRTSKRDHHIQRRDKQSSSSTNFSFSFS